MSYQQYSKHVIKSCELDPITPTFNIQLGSEANLVLVLHPYKNCDTLLIELTKPIFPGWRSVLTEQWDIGFSLSLQSIKPRGLINVSQNINEDLFCSVGTLRRNRDVFRCITDSDLMVIQVHNHGNSTLKSVTQT